jgi:hypothetical protein
VALVEQRHAFLDAAVQPGHELLAIRSLKASWARFHSRPARVRLARPASVARVCLVAAAMAIAMVDPRHRATSLRLTPLDYLQESNL